MTTMPTCSSEESRRTTARRSRSKITGSLQEVDYQRVMVLHKAITDLGVECSHTIKSGVICLVLTRG